jgi:hypothetical protein
MLRGFEVCSKAHISESRWVMSDPPENSDHTTLIHGNIIGLWIVIFRSEIYHWRLLSGERLQPFNTGDERSGFFDEAIRNLLLSCGAAVFWRWPSHRI